MEGLGGSRPGSPVLPEGLAEQEEGETELELFLLTAFPLLLLCSDS